MFKPSMKKLSIVTAGVLLAGSLFIAFTHCSPAGDESLTHSFEKIELSSTFYAEGAGIGDLNGNGQNDVICGPYWYEGPDFEARHAFYEPHEFDPLGYSDNFIVATEDLNGNGWNDILIVGFPGQQAYWYENPQGGQGHWPRHLIHPAVDNESPAFVDFTGDGRLELVFHTDGYIGYAKPDRDHPTRPWEFTPVSEQGEWGHFNHGFGIGDVNGNGYNDFLMKEGWWENPGESWDGQTPWEHHPVDFGPGGAQMYAWDVDGDGYNDVITSLEAHGWGLAWFRQVRAGGEIHFEKHLIMGDSPETSPSGVLFSQPHAVILADMNNNGNLGILSGKRYWAHGPDGDPEPNARAVVYWFEPERGSNGEVSFIPYLIDDNSGVGTQFSAGDLTGNGFADVVACNKKGGFVFLNQPETVTS
jgi:hypothetical protein